MPRFNAPPVAPPPPSAPDLNVEKKKPDNVKEYMRWVRNDFQREWVDSLGHQPSAAEQAAFDARPPVAAVESVINSGDPAAQLDTINGDPATALINKDIVGFSFFTAGKGGDARTRKALLDDATAHARTLFVSTDPATGAVTVNEAAIQAARKLFETGEYYRDEKPVRETVWRAMNPGGRDAAGNVIPPPPMPEDFDLASVSPEIQQKAEGFVTTRQQALHGRSIAAILGESTQEQEEAHNKKWFSKWRSKKGYTLEQREKMLEELKGLILEEEYQTLDTKLKKEENPAYEPEIVSDGTIGGDIAAAAERTKTKENYDRHITGWANVEQTKKEAYNAAECAFYGELGHQRFLKERPAAMRTSATDATPITDAAEIARRETALKRRIATEVLVKSMTGTDQDFEKMKREQFLGSVPPAEKGRVRKSMESWLKTYQELPTWKKVVIGAGVSGVLAVPLAFGTTFLPLFLPFGLGGYLTGQSLVLAEMGAGAYATSRIAKSLAAAPLAAIFRTLVLPGQERKHLRQRQDLEKDQTKKTSGAIDAVDALDTATAWLRITQIMQKDAEKNQKEMEKLQGTQWWKRLGLSASAGLVAGFAVGIASPKVADALTPPTTGDATSITQLPGIPNTQAGPNVAQLPGPDADAPRLPGVPPPAPGIQPPVAPKPTIPAPSPSAPRAGMIEPGLEEPFSAVGKGIDNTVQGIGDIGRNTWKGFRSLFSFGDTTPITPRAPSVPADAGASGTAGLDRLPGSSSGKDLVTTGPGRAPIEHASTGEGAASHESILPIKGRGPQGAIIDKLVEGGMPKTQAQSLAGGAWEEYAPKALKDKNMLAQMKKLGYPQNRQGLLDMMTRIPKGQGLIVDITDPQHPHIAGFGNETHFMGPTRPRVSHQPTAARPKVTRHSVRPSYAFPDKPGQPIDLTAQEVLPADIAPRTNLIQQNLKTTGLDNPRWGKDFWNSGFKGKGMTIDKFANRMVQLEDQMKIPNNVVDYSDVVGGGATQYDIQELAKTAQLLKKIVPPGEQSTTTVEQAFQKNSLGNNPPVTRPRAVAPQQQTPTSAANQTDAQMPIE